MRGSVIKRGKSWSYVVDLGRDPATGRRRQRWKGGWATKREAELALHRVLGRVGSGEVADAGALTVGAFLEQWLVGLRPSLKPTTAKSYGDVVKWHVQPRLGAIRLSELNALHLQGLYADLYANGKARGKGGLSARTVQYVHRILGHALRDAVAWGLIVKSPAALVKPPRVVQRDVQAWTPDQARRFLELVDGDRLYTMWVVFLSTGLRRSEVAGLRWSDVNLDAGMLAVRQTRVSVGWQVHTSDPKTRSSRRTVSLDARVVAVLRAHRRRQLEERLAWGEAWVESGYVFCVENGEPIHPEDISTAFERLVKQLGLPEVRLHDLRHTSATLALAAGIHPKVVSERLGHSSIAITLDLYSHVIPGLQEEAAEKLGELILGDG